MMSVMTSPATARARGRQRRRRRPPPLLVILLVGLAALVAVFLVARAVQTGRSTRGPYLLGAWTFGNGASLDRAVKAGALDEVSCDWLQSRADGGVAAPQLDNAFVDRARRAGCRVFVTLTDYDQTSRRFDRRISAAILASPQTRRAHAAAVTGWVKAHGFDGLDVDWEALRGTQRGAFSDFVRVLAAQAHAKGLQVAVDVYPKLTEPGSWDGPRSEDWAALGKAVDQFRIMTYDYSGSWSGPGPLSPPVWVDRVLTFAQTKVAARKIIMGVGLYGRLWHGSRTTDLRWVDLQGIIAREAPRRSRGASRELVLRYRTAGQAAVAYFPDAKALAAKLRVLRQGHPHVGGIYCWLMGEEDPAVWPLIAARLRS